MPDRTLGKDGSGLGLDTRLLETRVADLADLWDDMYSDADKTAKEFNQTMVEGAEQYRKKLVEIAEQLEQQRRTMIQLQELAGTPAAGTDTALQAQRATVQLELERNKLQELEIQFDRTYDAMRSFLAQQNKISSAPLRAIQPQQAGGAKADAAALCRAACRFSPIRCRMLSRNWRSLPAGSTNSASPVPPASAPSLRG